MITTEMCDLVAVLRDASARFYGVVVNTSAARVQVTRGGAVYVGPLHAVPERSFACIDDFEAWLCKR